MGISLYPSSERDRLAVWAGAFQLLVTSLAVTKHDWWWAALFGFFALFSFALAYLVQDQPPDSSADEYGAVIEQIKGIAAQFSALNAFLEKERARVVETEDIVRNLRNEKAVLEPVVSRQRVVVEAILAAHSRRNAASIWKERALGFGSGVLASLLAGYLYDAFQR